VTDGFFPVPVASDLMSVFVESAASVAMSEYVGIIILERLLGHEKIILFLLRYESSRSYYVSMLEIASSPEGSSQ